MGTGALLKKVKVYKQENYIVNFIQSIFDPYKPEDYKGKALIIWWDGRFYNDVSIQFTIKIDVANGVRTINLTEIGLKSTQNVSLIIRSQPKGECMEDLFLLQVIILFQMKIWA